MLNRHGPGASPIHILAHVLVDFDRTRCYFSVTWDLLKLLKFKLYITFVMMTMHCEDPEKTLA